MGALNEAILGEFPKKYLAGFLEPSLLNCPLIFWKDSFKNFFKEFVKRFPKEFLMKLLMESLKELLKEFKEKNHEGIPERTLGGTSERNA